MCGRKKNIGNIFSSTYYLYIAIYTIYENTVLEFENKINKSSIPTKNSNIFFVVVKKICLNKQRMFYGSFSCFVGKS